MNSNEHFFLYANISTHVLLPIGAIDQLPHLLEIWNDLKMDNTMFHKVKDWSPSHLVYFGWYMDCPKDNIPSSEILLQKKNELDSRKSLLAMSMHRLKGKKERDLYGKKKRKEQLKLPQES